MLALMHVSIEKDDQNFEYFAKKNDNFFEFSKIELTENALEKN